MGDSIQRRELKPPLTYDKQLQKFKGRNLIVQDENIALQKLKQCNYYRLTAYTLHLKQDDVFLPGTTFEQITHLYDFDSQLRNMMIPLLERIEIAFRTHIAYLLANKYNDPLSYRDKKHFANEADHAKIIVEVDNEINRSKEKFALHHKKNYDGQFPVWVAVELMSFGNLSKMFGIMKREDQRQIAKEHYSISAKYAKSWLGTLSYVRNLCAHYARLYNKTLTRSPLLFESEKHKISNKRIFAAILLIKRFTLDYTAWRTFLGSLVGLIETYDDIIDLDLIGFPENWIEWLQDGDVG